MALDAGARLVAGSLIGQIAIPSAVQPIAAQGLRQRIIEFIDHQICNPDLGLDLIIQYFHLSRAYLYRLFDGTDGVARLIREKRLDLGYRMLTATPPGTIRSPDAGQGSRLFVWLREQRDVLSSVQGEIRRHAAHGGPGKRVDHHRGPRNCIAGLPDSPATGSWPVRAGNRPCLRSSSGRQRSFGGAWPLAGCDNSLHEAGSI